MHTFGDHIPEMLDLHFHFRVHIWLTRCEDVGPTFSNNKAQAAIMFDRHLGRHSLISPNISATHLENVGPTVSYRGAYSVNVGPTFPY